MCGSYDCNKQDGGVAAESVSAAHAIDGPRGNANDCARTKPLICSGEVRAAKQFQGERVPCIGDYEQHLFENPDDDFCDKGPKNPYHIPGYAGHVPTIQSHAGHTFGQDSHQVLKSHPGHPASMYNKGTHICPEPMHQPYRIPGYTGHVPGLKGMVGGTYGGDTHKLLYDVDSYPNRQENLSPYRPGMGSQYGNGSKEDPPIGSHMNGRSAYNGGKTSELSSQAQPHLGEANTSFTYERPKEHNLKPQYKYRIADTYATRADITLVDPCVNKESKVVISTRELDDTQVVRTQDCLEERVETFPYINKPIRHRPMVPGFDAFVDALRGARGQRFEFTAVSPLHRQLQQQLVLEKGEIRDLPGRDKVEGTKNGKLCPPHGLDDIPFGYSKYGAHHKYTNSALYDFTSNYRRRVSSEWAPAGISRPDPPAFDIPGEIYNEHMGLVPGYSAHVPGAMFRCGKNFTDDSRDAKKALRGDRF